jgi:uncharacterized protein (DUF58 family)
MAGLLALVALAALVLPLAVVAIAGLALLGATAMDGALARRRPALERSAPDVLARGVAARLEASASGAVTAATLRQPLPADIRVEPSRGDGELTAAIVADRRGRHVLPPLAARHRGPLGLAARFSEGAGSHEVRVYPDLPAARRIAESVRRSGFRDQGMRGRGQLGLGTEFELVREYNPDDDIRQVNWLASARLGRPMSNEYRLEQDRDVVALIDSGRLMAAPSGTGTMLDAALDALAALAAVADEMGDRFGTLAFDSSVRHRLNPRRGGGALAVTELFDLQPSSNDSDYPRAFQQVEGTKRAFVVVFTDLLDEVAARSLIDGVPVLARRHFVVVATLRDAALSDALSGAAGRRDGAYEALAALAALEARNRAATRLRHAGAEVLEAPAGRLGGLCVRAYLRAKSRARL